MIDLRWPEGATAWYLRGHVPPDQAIATVRELLEAEAQDGDRDHVPALTCTGHGFARWGMGQDEDGIQAQRQFYAPAKPGPGAFKITEVVDADHLIPKLRADLATAERERDAAHEYTAKLTEENVKLCRWMAVATGAHLDRLCDMIRSLAVPEEGPASLRAISADGVVDEIRRAFAAERIGREMSEDACQRLCGELAAMKAGRSTPSDLTHLRELAEAATPGKWPTAILDRCERAERALTATQRQRNEARRWAVDLEARLEEARRERDAYKLAKAQNDERFMIERDEARRERDAAIAERDAALATVRALALRLGVHAALLGLR